MKTMLRRVLDVSAVLAGLTLCATPALAQGRHGNLPPGLAMQGKCPPGHAKKGACSYDRYGERDTRYDRYDTRRDGRYDGRYGDRDDDRIRTNPTRTSDRARASDWCWDRNRDGRCDTTANDRIYTQNDTRYDPRYDRTTSSDRERGGYVDRTVGVLIDRARQASRGR